jgi:hypothetical protein
MGKTKPPRLTETDREAMTRAIETGRQRGKAAREQLDDFLRLKPWREVGEFAAYGLQCETLRLKPWQSPPCEIGDPDACEFVRGDDIHGYRTAARLLRRLLEAGLSRYEPDPIAALERAEGVTVDAAE